MNTDSNRSKSGGAGGAGSYPIQRAPADATKPLSYGQQQLWFLAQLRPGDMSYNVPFYLRLRGELDVDALRQALHAILDRHQVLRTTYEAVDGTPIPRIAPDWSLDLRSYDLRPVPEAKRDAAAQLLLKREAS